MGFFGRLFGKKPAASASDPLDENEDIQHTGSQPIHGPPEFIRAVELQRTYWTHDAEAHSQLEARSAEQRRERLRLHHLICLQRLNSDPERAASTEKCQQTVDRLLASDSPYRPRFAMVWQGQSAEPGRSREPHWQGKFLNLSLTHLGCLEIYRVDGANQLTGIDFVGFDELSGVLFAPPKLIRAAKLIYDDGRAELVFVPMLYGLTWAIGNEYERDGSMTRFEPFPHVYGWEADAVAPPGLGVGQQDFSIRNQDGTGAYFGIGSVAEILFPLDIRDHRFDEKARARGIDPDEVRRRDAGRSRSAK
jgi:hypothetical protein